MPGVDSGLHMHMYDTSTEVAFSYLAVVVSIYSLFALVFLARDAASSFFFLEFSSVSSVARALR